MSNIDANGATETASHDATGEPHYLTTAERTKASLETKVGNTERTRRIEINAVAFFEAMRNCPSAGTFIWEGPKRGRKFSNIFEALAAKQPAFEECNFSEQYEFIQEWSPKLQSGFYAARRWLSEWYGSTVFKVPSHNESSVQTVLTLDPDFVLECGITASQMQTRRDFKLAEGQVRSSVRRVAASGGKQQAAHFLDKVLSEARNDLFSYKPTRTSISNETDD